MRIKLRTRVLAATLILVTLGLAAAGVATYGFLRSFLLHRLDQQLVAAEFPAGHALFERVDFGGPEGSPNGSVIPPGTYAAFFDETGRLITQKTLGYPSARSLPAPKLPSNLSRPERGSEPSTYTTGSAGGAGPDFRVAAFAVTVVTAGTRGTLVVAIPLAEVEGTLHRLVWVELGVAAGVLLAVGGLSWWLIRLGLRPLDRMALTAGSIAAGDLSRRVEPADDETEVGRLGLALNTMLGQIETAFEHQRASEGRLRRFVADASHELRTPITSIRGYAELFRRGAASRPDDLERAMRRIEDEGARMGLLVDDLLLLARLDQGRPLEREPVDLATVVEDAVGDARAVEPDRPIDLSMEESLVVLGDERRLHQVIANLLENARTHTTARTPVSVRLGRSADTAALEVADSGLGMSPEEASNVFERFYRGDPSRSRTSGGTGLGLAIAAAIVESHGGRITVSSRPGEGATFVVSLPLAPEASPGRGDGLGILPGKEVFEMERRSDKHGPLEQTEDLRKIRREHGG
jgi:two-component system, OmpR family, sensor kinase